MPTIHEATSRACGMSGRSTRAPIARPWSRGDGLLESRNGAADGNDGQAVRRSAPSWLVFDRAVAVVGIVAGFRDCSSVRALLRTIRRISDRA